MDNTKYSSLVKQLVDDLKGIFTTAGLGGEPGEYKLLTQSFLYKFINDKFLYEAKVFDAKNDYDTIMKMTDDDYEFLQMDLGNKSAKIKREDLIESLFNHQNEDGFYMGLKEMSLHEQLSINYLKLSLMNTFFQLVLTSSQPSLNT